MTAAAYQRALADCIASPELCLAVRRDAAAALAPYGLDDRDRRRLAAMVRQPGMSLSCTLYRLNRITPLATLLPLTSVVLGERFVPLAEEFWRTYGTDLQFHSETDAFAEFLRARHAAGELDAPDLPDVLAYELAVNAVRFRAD